MFPKCIGCNINFEALLCTFLYSKKKKKNSIRINTIWDFLLVSLLRENLKSGGLHF